MLARVDVVIESVFYRRADAELHAGIQLLQGLGQKVGRRVPEGVLALRVVPFEQLDRGVLVDGAGDVPFLAVDFSRQDVGCEARADALGDLEGRHALGKLLYASVREGDIYHILY